MFAHSLGLWERLGGLTGMADGADVLVGLAQLIAEANGLAGQAHIKEKISEMIIHATVVRACFEAAIAHSEVGEFGAAFPNELYTNAGKYTGAASYNLMVRHLHDIAGGAVVTAPSISDLENAEVGHLARKYMSTMNGVDGEYRTRLFHAIRDLTADSYGGWTQVTNIQAGGGLYAQRIVTRKPLRPRRSQAGRAAGRRPGRERLSERRRVPGGAAAARRRGLGAQATRLTWATRSSTTARSLATVSVCSGRS